MIFLVQCPHPWRGIRQRPHHLMTRFARRGHTVRWVEPRYVRWLAGRRAGDFLRARRETPVEGLQVRPVTLLNGERLGPIRAFNQRHLARALTSPLPPGADTDTTRVLWLYNPHEVHLADRVPHDLLIYDIMDEFRGFPWSPPRIEAEERALLARADWVFAGTHALYEAKRSRAEGRIEEILSGVETAHFSLEGRPTPQPDAAHRAARAQHRRLIGYAGMIDLRVDQDLLVRAARERPDWGFVLVGPVVCDVARLSAAPNIHLLGARPYDDLPACYRAWDAAMLPFVENELTRHINPTKMLEYAAADRPILARALPDIARCYADGAWLYDNADAFLAQLDAITDDGADATHTKKLDAARRWTAERDWDALTERMLTRVRNVGCRLRNAQ